MRRKRVIYHRPLVGKKRIVNHATLKDSPNWSGLCSMHLNFPSFNENNSRNLKK